MSGFTDWMRAVLGGAQDEGPESEEVKALTNQFYVSLRAYLSAIESQGTADSNGVLERVRNLAEKSGKERTWHDAYDLEQQLVLLFDDETLETELERRLLEARTSLPPEVVTWYQSTVQAAQAAKKRPLLTRLVNDIQWRYTKDEARRGYTKQITKRTEIVFTVSAFLFAITVVTVVIATNHLLVLPFVGAAGAFGAAFSMMTSLKSRLGDSTFDDLKLNRSWGLILARILVGIGASYVLYFFIASELLSGDAFPALGGGDAETEGDAGGADGGSGDATSSLLFDAEFAKLFIWSFISGFSEKLVPNLLARTEGRLNEPAQLPPQGGQVPPIGPDSPRAPVAVSAAPEGGASGESTEPGVSGAGAEMEETREPDPEKK